MDESAAISVINRVCDELFSVGDLHFEVGHDSVDVALCIMEGLFPQEIWEEDKDRLTDEGLFFLSEMYSNDGSTVERTFEECMAFFNDLKERISSLADENSPVLLKRREKVEAWMEDYEERRDAPLTMSRRDTTIYDILSGNKRMSLESAIDYFDRYCR